LGIHFSVDLLPVLSSAAVDVVNGEEVALLLSAAGALSAVGCDDGFAQALVVQP
jgi:hypothetical protein